MQQNDSPANGYKPGGLRAGLPLALSAEFAELEPATGAAGDVIAFCTNVMHCASRNVDTKVAT